MNPVEMLAKLNISREEKYHADDYDHVQYEEITPSFDFGLDPASLLAEINRQALWPSFYQMLTSKPDTWMVALSYYLPKEQDYSIEYMVYIINKVKSPDDKVYLMQHIAGWPWTTKALQQAPTILRYFQSLQQAIQKSNKDEFSIKCEQQMYLDIITELKNMLTPQ